jgi:hypothetical protein
MRPPTTASSSPSTSACCCPGRWRGQSRRLRTSCRRSSPQWPRRRAGLYRFRRSLRPRSDMGVPGCGDRVPFGQSDVAAITCQASSSGNPIGKPHRPSLGFADDSRSPLLLPRVSRRLRLVLGIRPRIRNGLLRGAFRSPRFSPSATADPRDRDRRLGMGPAPAPASRREDARNCASHAPRQLRPARNDPADPISNDLDQCRHRQDSRETRHHRFHAQRSDGNARRTLQHKTGEPSLRSPCALPT